MPFPGRQVTNCSSVWPPPSVLIACVICVAALTPGAQGDDTSQQRYLIGLKVERFSHYLNASNTGHGDEESCAGLVVRDTFVYDREPSRPVYQLPAGLSPDILSIHRSGLFYRTRKDTLGVIELTNGQHYELDVPLHSRLNGLFGYSGLGDPPPTVALTSNALTVAKTNDGQITLDRYDFGTRARTMLAPLELPEDFPAWTKIPSYRFSPFCVWICAQETTSTLLRVQMHILDLETGQWLAPFGVTFAKHGEQPVPSLESVAFSLADWFDAETILLDAQSVTLDGHDYVPVADEAKSALFAVNVAKRSVTLPVLPSDLSAQMLMNHTYNDKSRLVDGANGDPLVVTKAVKQGRTFEEAHDKSRALAIPLGPYFTLYRWDNSASFGRGTTDLGYYDGLAYGGYPDEIIYCLSQDGERLAWYDNRYGFDFSPLYTMDVRASAPRALEGFAASRWASRDDLAAPPLPAPAGSTPFSALAEVHAPLVKEGSWPWETTPDIPNSADFHFTITPVNEAIDEATDAVFQLVLENKGAQKTWVFPLDRATVSGMIFSPAMSYRLEDTLLPARQEARATYMDEGDTLERTCTLAAPAPGVYRVLAMYQMLSGDGQLLRLEAPEVVFTVTGSEDALP